MSYADCLIVSSRRQGGGVATLIRQGLQYTRMANPTSMESVIIKLKMESSDIIVINVYDSPDNHVNETSYRQLFQSFHRNAIILGDFNAHGSVFGAKASEINKRGMLLEELLDTYNMVSLNTGAGTYIKHSGELSRLDIAMTTPNLARVINWKVLNDTLGSDHLVVEMAIKDHPVSEDTSIPKWSYRRADWDAFKKHCVQLITSDIMERRHRFQPAPFGTSNHRGGRGQHPSRLL